MDLILIKLSFKFSFTIDIRAIYSSRDLNKTFEA